MATNSTMSNGKETATVNGEPVLKRSRDSLHETLRSHKEPQNEVTVVLGAQWGDEGKGKVVDLLAMDADIVCRGQVLQEIGDMGHGTAQLNWDRKPLFPIEEEEGGVEEGDECNATSILKKKRILTSSPKSFFYTSTPIREESDHQKFRAGKFAPFSDLSSRLNSGQNWF